MGHIKTIEFNGFKDAFDKYFKESFKFKLVKRKSNNMNFDEVSELLNLIKNSKDEWRCSVQNYELMTEFEMIDYYAYQIKAHELRFEYLLKQAKEKGIRANVFNGL